MQDKFTINHKISENLREILRKTGWKQVDIAHALSVSPVTVNRWLKGDRHIKRSYLQELATLLGVGVSDFTGERDLTNILTKSSDSDAQTLEDWKRRALVAEQKLKHLKETCDAMEQHVAALGCTVQSFGRIISW